MDTFVYLIIFSVIGGLISLLGGLILIARKDFAAKVTKYIIPFAAGALLAAVFLDLLPEGIDEDTPQNVLYAALAGILLFFLAERFLRWFHHHHDEDENHQDPAVPLIITGDVAHNALDGVAIAAAFLISVPTGIVTTLAVAAHEIPKEMGIFGLLMSKGMKPSRVLFVNIMSSFATVIAAVAVYMLGSDDKLEVGILLGLSAGFLLYVALSDIIPTIHAQSDASKLMHVQTLMLILGVVVVGLSINLAHEYIDSGHEQKQNEKYQGLECAHSPGTNTVCILDNHEH